MKLIEHKRIAKDIKILEHGGDKFERREYFNGEIEWIPLSYDGEAPDGLENAYHTFLHESLVNAFFNLGAKG